MSKGNIGLTGKENENILNLVLDHQGLPLIPQPSSEPNDPMNWPRKLKWFVLFQAAFLAFTGTLNTAIINPAYVPMAKEFGITVVQASYQTTIVIAINGIGPFLWIPLSRKYGKRSIYLFTTLLGIATALGAGGAKTYSQLLAVRFLQGWFPSAMALAAGTAADLFYMHERGKAIGLYTMLMTNGAHFAPIAGGLLGQYLGWRWCFWFSGILNGFVFVFIFFCMPETSYDRSTQSFTPNLSEDEYFKIRNGQRYTRKSYKDGLRIFHIQPNVSLKLSDFVWPVIKIARHWNVTLPALYYSFQYGFGSILPAVTVAGIFSTHFGWSTLDIGLAYGLSLFIGAGLGEIAGGLVVDYVLQRARKRDIHGKAKPEARLAAIWTGEILVPAGLLIYGFGIAYRAAWFGPIFGMGLACFGVQSITTVCYTYSVDCHKQHATDVAQLYNFIRQEVGMTFAFYTIIFANAIGFQYVFLFFALLGSVVFFLPMLYLMFRGDRMRQNNSDTDEMIDLRPAASRDA